MPSKCPSNGSREEVDGISSELENDNIMDGASVEDMSESFHGPASDSSSPVHGSSFFARGTDRTSLKDVWLGEKYLASIVALQLYSQEDTDQAVSDLEVRSGLLNVSATRR
jgi:hypothetical protein